MADRIKNYQQEADQITTLKAIRTDLGVTPSSYTPDATVVTKDRVVTFAQAEEELVVLSDIEKGVKQQVTEVDIAQKDVANIKALLQGHLYDYQTDTNSAYTKSVPAGAMPYAGLEKIGGKTVVWNQLAKNPTLASKNNVTVTKTGNMYTFTGTATSYSSFLLTPASDNLPIISGHKYYVGGFVTNENNVLQVRLCVDADGNTGWVFSQQNAILSPTASGNLLILIVVGNGTTVNATIYPMVIDLTLMFGAGNEPSTTAEVEAMFPADYYEFNEGGLLSAGVTSVVSKDSNNATLQTYPIPASIQALEGYGWSAGTAYNYVDFERKVFVQNVGEFRLKNDLTYFTVNSGSVSDATTFYVYNNHDLDKITHDNRGCVADKLVAVNNAQSTTMPFTVSFHPSAANSNYLYIKLPYSIQAGLSQSSPLADLLAAAKTWLTDNDPIIYYELSTPIETDISQYLTDDNLVEVESGGTLTFPNQNGTDYQIPVPSEETYMIDLQSAIGG